MPESNKTKNDKIFLDKDWTKNESLVKFPYPNLKCYAEVIKNSF